MNIATTCTCLLYTSLLCPFCSYFQFLRFEKSKIGGIFMTINSNRSIFIPKHTPDFQPMRYVFCETETVSKFVPRADFMRLLEQQPCPMAQVNIDLAGGSASLFPYCPERAEAFIQLNRAMAAEYKRHYRNWQKIKAGTCKTELSLDMEMTEDGLSLIHIYNAAAQQGILLHLADVVE